MSFWMPRVSARTLRASLLAHPTCTLPRIAVACPRVYAFVPSTRFASTNERLNAQAAYQQRLEAERRKRNASIGMYAASAVRILCFI